MQEIKIKVKALDKSNCVAARSDWNFNREDAENAELGKVIEDADRSLHSKKPDFPCEILQRVSALSTINDQSDEYTWSGGDLSLFSPPVSRLPLLGRCKNGRARIPNRNDQGQNLQSASFRPLRKWHRPRTGNRQAHRWSSGCSIPLT
jgi:hypothetical protein